MSRVDDLAAEFLADIMADFLGQNLGSDALSKQYRGPPIPALEAKYCANGAYSRIDFDLALKQLEEKKYVKTGPMVPYENTPGSSLFIIAIYSKREFVHLTEKGYKAAQTIKSKPKTTPPIVQISGGTFHQSPIGIGSNVNQSISFNLDSDTEVVEYLDKLLAQYDPAAAGNSKANITALVATAKTGDLAKTKPIFQHIFGAAQETAKQLAWGVITAYVTKQLGL